MNNYKEQLEEIKSTIEENKITKAKLEERKSTLEEKKQEILGTLAEEELDTKELSDEINKLEQEIKKELSKCEELLEDEE